MMEFKKPKKYDPEYRVETYHPNEDDPEYWEKYYWDENGKMRRWESSKGIWYEQDEEGILTRHSSTDWVSDIIDGT